MKIITIVGTRPQFVKAIAVSRAIQVGGIGDELILHTGQHYDENMSAIFFRDLGLPDPAYRLRIGSSSHGVQTGQMLQAIESVLNDVRPDWVLVYGDANSTLAGALAAVKQHIPVAHIEAGLRSFERRMPEEVNRVLTDHSSTLLFVPTEAAAANLRREGISDGAIHVVGDVMYDTVRYFRDEATRDNHILSRLGLQQTPYVLSTIHRAENTDDEARLRTIVGGLRSVAARTPVVMPLHPRTRAALDRTALLESLRGAVRLLDPVGYFDMIELERNASVIATDSGGVQKEAFFHRVPCVTLRDETEWKELVELGWNHLVPPSSSQAVADGITRAFGKAGKPASLYGDGNAAQQIVAALAGA